jgi:acid phosphatase
MPRLRLALTGVLLLALAGCSSVAATPQSSNPAVPTTAPLQAAVPAQAVTKVLVVVEENHSLAQMSVGMPYTFGLAKRFGYATNYVAIRHPSLPNYIAIAGGQTYGITDDANPSAHPITGQSVFGQAVAAGKTAAVYAEGMPQNCALVSGGSDYAVKHNPLAYFTTERTLCQKHDVPITQLGGAIRAGTLPTVGMVVPNLCNDAHNCPLSTADSWFEGWMTQIFAGPDWKSGHLAVVLTADEDNNTSGNRVLTVVIHPSQTGNVVTTPLTHYSLTRLYEDVAGVPYLHQAGTAPSLSKAFRLPLPNRG